MLLAIDTSTRSAGLALYDGAQVLSENIWSSPDYHTVELAPAIAQALQRAGDLHVPHSPQPRPSTTSPRLQAVAVALGPGSFTGLRIGLAAAKGICLARRIPLIGIPTLDFLAAAQPAHPETPLWAVLQAGRGRLALGKYYLDESLPTSTWQRVGDFEVATIESLAAQIERPTIICGELGAEERKLLARKRKNVLLTSPAASLRRPAFLAEIAWQRLQAGEDGGWAFNLDALHRLAPIYLHIGEPIPT